MTKEEIKAELADLKEQAKELSDGPEAILIGRIEELEQMLQTFKNFNKQRFLDNYKALMAKTGIKVGQIEAEAQVSPGYLSRLDKEGNTSDPSIEYICACAKLFNVSLDELLNGTVEEMTETEAFIADFTDDLISDTMKDTINWNEVPNYDGEPIDDMEADTFEHPLFFLNSPEINPPYSNQVITYWSRYDNQTRMSKKYPSYSAILPNTNDRIFFMGCELNDTVVYEMYLYIGEELNPICNTKDVCEAVRHKLRTLYEEIRKSGKRVHISTSAMNSISNYMKRRGKGA